MANPHWQYIAGIAFGLAFTIFEPVAALPTGIIFGLYLRDMKDNL